MPLNIKTDVYPGFPTDMQPQWIALMCLIQRDESYNRRHNIS